MFENVVIGLDGRQGGRDAVSLSTQLAAPTARLTLAHINASFGGRRASQATASERARALWMLECERDAAGVTAQLVVHAGRNVGQGLHELAEQRAADLLIVGSCHRALLGRALLGDDARAALNGTPCPVVIAPRGYAQAHRELGTLGVGFDGSPESELALSAARQLARRTGARVRALRVVSLQDVREQTPLPADWPQTTEELTRRSREQLRMLDGIDGDAVSGGCPEELERLSGEVDLLLVGSRRLSGPGRLHPGSVSRYLLTHSACPLVVLPALHDGRPGHPAQPHRISDQTGTRV